MSRIRTVTYIDRRLDFATSYDAPQDTTYRTPVEVLEKRYAALVEKQASETKRVVPFVRVRGGRQVTHRIVLTSGVKRRLNALLPRLRAIATKDGAFTAADLALLAGVRTPAANRYINILLAFKIVKSDEKPWGATYVFVDEKRML